MNLCGALLHTKKTDKDKFSAIAEALVQ